MRLTSENIEIFYNKVESFIIKQADLYGLSKKDLEEYYHCKPECDITKEASLSSIYKRLLGSLQNRQSLPNIIKFWHKDYESIYQETLFAFDPQKVQKKYNGVNGAERLFEDLNDKVHWNAEHYELPKQWCEGAIGAAKVLSRYSDSKSLYEVLMKQAENGDLMKIADYWDKLPIKGMGFALSCDFLKEIGIDLPKPDVHIIAVIKEVFFCGKDISEKELTAAFINMVKMLKEEHPEMTAYKLDKMIWLICTGNFYLHSAAPKTMRDCLIAKIN